MSKLSDRLRKHSKYPTPGGIAFASAQTLETAADALDAMESALRAARATMIDLLEAELGREVTAKDMGPSFHKLDAALLKLEGK